MIAFTRNNVSFGLRVAGIAIHDGHVLLHRAECDDFWALPGGRAELLEPAVKSLEREMKEEMNAQVTVLRLLWVLENFFEYRQPCHEVGLYFLIDLGPGFTHYDKVQPFYGHEDGPDSEANLTLIFRWFPIDRLEDVYLFPTFLRTALQDLPGHTQHIVHYDVDDGGK
jgi:ADP-ribose pyrophosphatase YjhB (NUDIX family)